MAALRQRFTPQQLIGLLVHAAGLRPTAAPVSVQELIDTFSWDKIGTDDIVIDTTKL